MVCLFLKAYGLLENGDRNKKNMQREGAIHIVPHQDEIIP
jgi:hypothetical protein